MNASEQEQPNEMVLPVEWHVSNEGVVDELEWHKIVSNPRVQSGLRRLAAEARRQIFAKETEEGGFAKAQIQPEEKPKKEGQPIG